jgi:Fe-S-cluster containining protein
MKICQHCGDCCNNFRSITADYLPEEADKVLSEMQFPVPVGKPYRMWLSFEIKGQCKHYDSAMKRCLDYNNRPTLCKEHWCSKCGA